MDDLTLRNNVVLSDYDYKRDIENRLFMSELSVFEVNVLKEMLDSSLQFSCQQLAEALDTNVKVINAVLKKLARSQLYKCIDNHVVVDKDMRKYYESQMMKFDEEFEPDMGFLQGLLSKVPISVLPSWYNISSISKNIFISIVENYLLTPKNYERYLLALRFHSPEMEGIVRDVFESADLKVNAKDLIKKYCLSREQFEEYMLLLEFNFVCCLSYSLREDCWEEIVTPFHEWRQFLKFERSSIPTVIKDDNNITVTTSAQANLSYDQILTHYRKTINMFKDDLKNHFKEYTEKDIREVERSLIRVTKKGWVYFDDFMKGFTAQIGKNEAVALQNKGKRWKYAIPTYSSRDYELVKHVLFEGLSPAGVIQSGTHAKRLCFCVTQFGRRLIEL